MPRWPFVWTSLVLLLLSGCSSMGASSPASPSGQASPVRPTIGQSTSAEPSPTESVLAEPITDARAFAELLGRIAERNGDPEAFGSGDDVGNFGVRQAWVNAGWSTDGFGPASPTSIDVHPLRGADTVDVPYVAYAVQDAQGRCFLGAVTWSPADDGSSTPSLTSVVIPGLDRRDCTAAVAAEEFGAIVGTMHGDQP